MSKKEHIVKYTTKQMAEMRSRGESQSDWALAAGMKEAEIEAAIARDPDEGKLVVDWTHVSVHLPQPKAVLNIRIDSEVLDFFRNQGRGYQTKINAVLRSYVEQMQQHPKDHG